MKQNLRSLSRFDFLKMIPTRKAKIAEAPARAIPSTDSYKPNELANALHPKCQHLIVSEITEREKDVKSYSLTPDIARGTEKLAYFSAGQYLSVALEMGSVKLTRPYSISSSPRESLSGRYELTVKRVDNGLASQYILDNWKVGTEVLASAPHGEFTYEPLRDARQIVGLAGGSGITPFVSLAKAIADGCEDANLTLIYGSMTEKEIIFRNELENLAAKCSRFKLVNVLCDEKVDGCEKGFITAELIRKYAPASGDYSIFVCGPQVMYDFVDKEIEKLGLRKKFIRHELFGEYRYPEKNDDYPKDAVGKKFKLTITICGEKKTVECDANVTLLNAMEHNGIAAPTNCRSGVCGWCHSRLVSGNVYVPKEVDGRRMADLQYGYVHPCSTFPLSDVEIDVPPFRL